MTWGDPLSKTSGNGTPGGAGLKATIYSLFFFAPTISAISPAMASLSLAYPDITPAGIGYVLTIAAAFQAITALITGAIAGRVVSYRALLVVSSILYVAGGCFPFFLADGQGFVSLLVSRAVFGIGTGIMMPLSNALIMACFSEHEVRTGLVGAGNVALNFGTVATNLIGGYLCLISWQMTFAVYALGSVVLVFSLLFLKGSIVPEVKEQDDGRGVVRAFAKSVAHLPAPAFGYPGLLLLTLIVTQPIIVYNAQLLAEAGIGTSVTAGYMTIAFAAGGVIASSLFKRIVSHLGSWLIPAAFFVAVLATALGYFSASPESGNIAMYVVAVFLDGASLLLVTCYVPVAVAGRIDAGLIAPAMGIVSFATAAGTFFAAPFAQVSAAIVSTGEIRAVLLCASLVTAVAMLVSLWALVRKARR